MFSWSIPTISSIQRTNVVLVVVSAAILAWFASTPAAVGLQICGYCRCSAALSWLRPAPEFLAWPPS